MAPRRIMGWREVAGAVLVLTVWLIPVAYGGVTNLVAPGFPPYFQKLQWIARLFPYEVRAWASFHIEVQREGSRSWKELRGRGYFDMSIFGYRTRLNRLLEEAVFHGDPWKRQITWEIANFVHRRHAELHPEGPPLVGVRFVQVAHSIEELAEQKGHFVRRPLAELGDLPQRRFGEVRFDGLPAGSRG